MTEQHPRHRDLSIRFDTQHGPVYAAARCDVDVPRGEIVGIVGESGSGKSTLALAIMRLLPGNAVVTGGADGVLRRGSPQLSDATRCATLRGTRIAMIFQDPMTSLNPVRSIGQQMMDIQYREQASRTEKLAKAARCSEARRHSRCREQLRRLSG